MRKFHIHTDVGVEMLRYGLGFTARRKMNAEAPNF
jgi:hypothetical protein